MTTSPVLSITDELLDDLQQKAKAAIDSRPPRDIPSAAYAAHMARFRCAANPETILSLVEHVSSLTERLEKAEKDAKRFRYIEDDADSGMSRIYGDNWIEVIDAAIAHEGEDHE